MTPMQQKFLNKRFEEGSIVFYLNIHGETMISHRGWSMRVGTHQLRVAVTKGTLDILEPL